MEKKFKIALFDKYPIETVFDHFPEEEVYKTLRKLWAKDDLLTYEYYKNAEAFKRFYEEGGEEKAIADLESFQTIQFFIISQLYLAKGNKEKAQEYFEKYYQGYVVQKGEDHFLRADAKRFYETLK